MNRAPSCPLCEGPSRPSPHPRPLRWRGQTFTYRRCASCATIFVDPQPTDDELSAWYAHGSYHAGFYASTRDDEYEPAVDA
ncbi:MAG: hypothetical protein EOO74_02035, partial [Myxococcales bacterium]